MGRGRRVKKNGRAEERRDGGMEGWMERRRRMCVGGRWIRGGALQDRALGFALRDGWLEGGDDGLVEYVLQLRASKRTTGSAFRSGKDPVKPRAVAASRCTGASRVWSAGKRAELMERRLTPFCVNAEHSTYLTAPSSRASRSPASGGTGRCFCLESFSSTAGSSRRSTWVPTMRQGTPGQWWWTCCVFHIQRQQQVSGRPVTRG